MHVNRRVSAVEAIGNHFEKIRWRGVNESRVPVFRQTTDFTCGACATLMVWRYFDSSVQLSKQNEFLIWTEIVGLPFKFSSPYRIAEFFMKKGFETELMLKQNNVSEDKIVALECCHVEPADKKLFLEFFRAYNRILGSRIASSILDRKPTVSDVREKLSYHRPIIALVDYYHIAIAKGGQAKSHLPHWVVITGYDDKRFHANDPAQGKIIIEERVLEEAMDTYHRFGWPSTLILVKPQSRQRMRKGLRNLETETR